MNSKMITVHLLLPNGKSQQFKIKSGKNWYTTLKTHVQELYPQSNAIRFVEELPKKPLSAGNQYNSNVMFEIRKNYYKLGHISAQLPK